VRVASISEKASGSWQAKMIAAAITSSGVGNRCHVRVVQDVQTERGSGRPVMVGEHPCLNAQIDRIYSVSDARADRTVREVAGERTRSHETTHVLDQIK
jgi:hypothetical protein